LGSLPLAQSSGSRDPAVGSRINPQRRHSA
jgi:hypothetical protein